MFFHLLQSSALIDKDAGKGYLQAPVPTLFLQSLSGRVCLDHVLHTG